MCTHAVYLMQKQNPLKDGLQMHHIVTESIYDSHVTSNMSPVIAPDCFLTEFTSPQIQKSQTQLNETEHDEKMG